MRRARHHVLILAALAATSSGVARADDSACWFEGGVVVLPAVVAGIAGDYILDTGSAHTQLDETRALSAGIAEPEVNGEVRLAGAVVGPQPIPVVDLDVRTWNLPTPVAGVIGADVLRGFVVDVSFAPCRVVLAPPARAPAFQAEHDLALTWDSGRPVARATVSDGRRTVEGPFVVATGSNVAVRLADDLAQAPGSSRPSELYPDGVWLAKLEGLEFAGTTSRDLAVGLAKPIGGEVGIIGGEALSGLRLRFDFPAGRLLAAPNPK